VNGNGSADAPGYPELPRMLEAAASSGIWESNMTDRIVPYLVQEWVARYGSTPSGGELVEVRVDGFSYLFDIGPDRLIAAWGISQGRFPGSRDKDRMRGHPKSAGRFYHRGHAIPHRLGGGTDINIAVQIGSVNMGPFRALEMRAVENPGSLYFTYWMYEPDSNSQVASRVQQGLLRCGLQPEIKTSSN
jgi:hypothetical protein